MSIHEEHRSSYEPRLTLWPDEFKGRLPLSELFYSIQGEGRWSGIPAVFIRLLYCNLGCVWCDTRYTWDQARIDKERLHSPAELVELALHAFPDSARINSMPHVVITGGEPMLHQDRLPRLIRLLRDCGFDFIEIETGGTISPTGTMIDSVDWWNCSPKLTNSLLHEKDRVNPEAIRTLASTSKVDFKFVVRSEMDVVEIKATYGHIVPSHRIWLMPQGYRRREQIESMAVIGELCLRYGYRFSPRLHTLIWDAERGR